MDDDAKVFVISVAARLAGMHPQTLRQYDRLGLVVERVLGQREIMVRALSDPLLKHPVVSGATELGDGRAKVEIAPRLAMEFPGASLITTVLFLGTPVGMIVSGMTNGEGTKPP